MSHYIYKTRAVRRLRNINPMWQLFLIYILLLFFNIVHHHWRKERQYEKHTEPFLHKSPKCTYFQYDFQYVEKIPFFKINGIETTEILVGIDTTLVCFDSKRGDNSIHYTTPKWRDCNAMCIDSITFYVKENDSFVEGMKHCRGCKNGFSVLGTVI